MVFGSAKQNDCKNDLDKGLFVQYLNNWCQYEESNFANIMNRRTWPFSEKFEFGKLQIL